LSSKREDILKTAMRLFTHEGFHATPTSRIAKEAGVATGTLFHHFASKEALINEIYIYVKRRLLRAMEEGFDAEAPFRTQLYTMWRNDIHWFNAHYDEFIFLQQYCHSDIIVESTRELLYVDIRRFLDLMRKAVERGEVKADNPEYIIWNYVANVQQNNRYFHQYPEEFTDANIAHHFEIYWSGLSR